MHHLHFRYATEQPKLQTTRRLFQLLDDMPADLRHPLLRDLFGKFDVFSDVPSEKEKQAAEYSALKSKLQELAADRPHEDVFIFGLVAFILGNVHRRATHSIFHFIQERRKELEDIHLEISESKSNDSDDEMVADEAATELDVDIGSILQKIDALRVEEERLRLAYEAFCEMVVGPLLGDEPILDFSSEWMFDDSEPLPPAAVKSALSHHECDQRRDQDVTGADAESPDSDDPIITTFLDQLAAHFELALKHGPGGLAVRVADKAVSVSVTEYCAPSEQHPTRPRILRLNVRGLSPYDRAFRQLGLPLHPKFYLKCRLEFSVLPDELALFPSWTAEWIRGQESQNPNPPTIPIPLAGEQEFFRFTGDENEGSPFVEPLSERARASFSARGSDWLSIEYLWSRAARTAYNAWANKDQTE